MKFVILHGTGANHASNWFEWLHKELGALGHEVWVPDLPNANTPKLEAYNKFLLESGYDFSDAVLIGHSSGAVAINALLQELGNDVKAKAAILIGVFRGDLGWQALKGVDIEFDYPKIKSKAGKFIVMHSDNDPNCPLDGAKWIARQLDAEFILIPAAGHFSATLDPRFTRFPELLDILKQKVVG